MNADLSDRPTHVPPKLRLLISCLVIGHLMAIVLPPLAFQTRGAAGSSPSVSAAIWPVRHYAEAIHTDRGYAFFAPDPGPSHLIQAIIEPGTPEQKEVFLPSHSEHWPRLLYHRHFMVAEYLNELYRPALPRLDEPIKHQTDSLTVVDVAIETASRERDRFERLWKSIDDHLAVVHRKSDGRPARIATRRVEHAVPNYAAYVAQPIELDDPQLYRVLLDAPASPESETPEPTSSDSGTSEPKSSEITPAGPIDVLTEPGRNR